jgi:ABC-type Fe3+ transport system substrate-binding protein
LNFDLIKAVTTCLLLSSLWEAPWVLSASAPPLLRAKQDAEAKGYIFISNRDEILSKAKQEGRLRVVTGVTRSAQVTTDAFKKAYPFIDIHSEALLGAGDAQRLLLEIKAGSAKDWDVVRPPTGYHNELAPYLLKIDILGMATHGVLNIPPPMIDPKNRNFVALLTRFHVFAYNKNLVPSSNVPKNWEDILKPEWKGKKFAIDVNPLEVAALIPAWGLEKTLAYARAIPTQQPNWIQGSSARVLTTIGAGETPAYFGPNYGVVKGYQQKDPQGIMQFVVLEPVPVRVTIEQGILSTARNPHAALLWLEFMAGTQAQRLIDQHEPLVASVYSKDSAAAQILKDKKLSVISWESNDKVDQWMEKIVEAYGFPRPAGAK